MSESLEEESRRIFERRMLTNYTLDEVKLRRLAFFFLVHSHIDIKLIALVVKAETEKLKRRGELSLDDHKSLSLKWSNGTFKQHLNWAKERSLLDSDEVRIAEETNRARDHFVHFEVGRFQLSHYFGEDVTSEAGYRPAHHGGAQRPQRLEGGCRALPRDSEDPEDRHQRPRVRRARQPGNRDRLRAGRGQRDLHLHLEHPTGRAQKA